MTYSPQLDGIRSIAILAVLIFHIHPAALRGGFTGVDVFLVLSGFLITSIILKDIREGSFSLLEFYLRRVQRLLPNVVLTVLVVLVLWTIFLPPSASRQVGSHGLWTVLNLSNIYAWTRLGGYWGDAADSAPLLHTWSLGVEEQFYLCFPCSLLLVARFQQLAWVRRWLVFAAALSFALCIYATRTHPLAAFYVLPARGWELLIGAVLAAELVTVRNRAHRMLARLGSKTQEAMGLAGCIIIIVGFILIKNGNGFPGWVSLAPTTGTALVILSVVDGRTMLSKLLSSWFLVGTGKLSYSLYLWHWPLIVLGNTLATLYGKPQIYGSVAGGIAGILLAWAAYAGVEQPLRKRGSGRAWRLTLTGIGFSVAVLSAAFVKFRPLVADPTERFDTPRFFGELYNAGKPEVAMANLAKSTGSYDVYLPRSPHLQADSWRRGGVLHLYGGGYPRVVIFGSSHALMYSRLIDEICRTMGLSVAFLGLDYGTPAFFESTLNPNFSSSLEAREFDDARKRWLREWRPAMLFVIDRWELRFQSSQGFDERLRSFLREVSPTAGQVIFVAQVPVLNGVQALNPREFVTWRLRRLGRLPRFYPDENEPIRKQTVGIAEAAMADFPNFRVLRADRPFYKEDGSIRYESGRSFFYTNGDHLTDAGTEVVRSLFQESIATADSSLVLSRVASR